MAFNIRVWFVPFALHLASPILGSSLSLLTIRGAARGEAPLRGPYGAVCDARIEMEEANDRRERAPFISCRRSVSLFQ